MRTRLVSMGNSRGIRLPKPLIEQAGLVDAVDMELRDGAIVIAAVREPRSGWAEAAARLSSDPHGGLLDEPTPTRFDEAEWRW